ncbi:hypothetical protein BH24ACT5_BH24ACT5_11490 [soil metagenome]
MDVESALRTLVIDASAGPVIAAAFDLGACRELRGPVARGEVGQIWRLETDRGTWAVKETFAGEAIPGLEDLVAYQESARARGVRSPAVMRDRAGQLSNDEAGSAVRVSEWVDLADADIDLDPVAVGQLVARMHQVPTTVRAPVDPWYFEPVGAERWDELVDQVEATSAPFAGDLRAIRDEMVALEEWFVVPCDVRMCHRDMWADNVRSTGDGSLWVIDWDSAGLADPAGELAMALCEFALRRPDRARTLMDTYAEAGGPARITGPGSFTMVTAQMGHLMVVVCRAWIERPPGDPERDRCIPRFAEFIDRPFVRATITELLDAVR